MRRAFLLSFAFVLTISSGIAWGYDIDLGPIGHVCDTCGGGVIGGLPVVGHPINEAIVSTAGTGLEQWINASRNTALNGAMPIPIQIRQQLTGYSSENSMNRVRYKIGDNGFANLARILEQAGYASAVTLNDVIVFRGPTEANDPSVWAHELTHVDQYNGNVHDFAVRYVRNYHDLEDPAYAKGDGYWAWANANNRRPSLVSINFPPAIIQSPPFGSFCLTMVGRFGPGPMQPTGAPCNVWTPTGLVWGNVGF